MADAALLALVQWLSPAFPTGAYAYSHGLEDAIAQGVVADAASLQAWMTDILQVGAGWQDAVLLAQALRPETDLAALDDLARALQPGAERLRETLEQGAALARTVAAISDRALPARAVPVALGQAAAALALAPGTVIGLFLQAFAGNLATIAVRHVPLGQTEGQQVLARLAPLVSRLAEAAARSTIEDLGGAALAADLGSIRHETQTVRIFRT